MWGKLPDKGFWDRNTNYGIQVEEEWREDGGNEVWLSDSAVLMR